MKHPHKLANPFFIFSLLLLIVNDWVLKSAFGNTITGKLSDVAGLFAFAYFFSSLLPKRKTTVHIITTILFIIWKTPLTDPLIYFLNNWGIPVSRTVDYSDYLALPVIVLSWYIFSLEREFQLRKWTINLLLILSPMAFVATSQAPSRIKIYEINKEYHFDYSRAELIARINELQLKELNRVKPFYKVDFDSKTNVFHTPGINDTLAILLDPDTTRPQDTIHYKSAFAYIQISGDETQSTLALVNAYLYDPKPKGHRKGHFTYLPPHTKYTPEEAVKVFEKRVIKKLKKKPHRKLTRPMENSDYSNQLSELKSIKPALLQALREREEQTEYHQLAEELRTSPVNTGGDGTAHLGAWHLLQNGDEWQLQRQSVSDKFRIIYTAYCQKGANNKWIIKDIKRTTVHKRF